MVNDGMLAHSRTELEYYVDAVRATNGAHIEVHLSCQ